MFTDLFNAANYATLNFFTVAAVFLIGMELAKQNGFTGQLSQADTSGSGRAHNIGDKCAERAGQNDRHQGICGCMFLYFGPAYLRCDHRK